MANIVWEDCRTNPQIEGPFLSYVTETSTKHFADWLLGITKIAPNGIQYAGRFGYIIPSNIISEFKKEQQKKKVMKLTKDKTIIDGLMDMLQDLYNQENTLYNDLGCKDFEGFKKIWEGQSVRNQDNDKKEIYNYWLNKYLELLTGETQRLLTSSNRTLIERILALASIELQSIGIEGDIEHYKKDIKNLLTEQKYLEISDVVYKETGNKIDVWVPTKEKYKNDDDFTDALTDFFDSVAAEQVTNEVVNDIEDSLWGQLGKAIGTVSEKSVRKSSPRNAKVNKMNRWKVTVNFGQQKDPKLYMDIYKKVWAFMKTAIVYKLNKTEYEQWLNDIEEYNIQDYVRRRIQQLCKVFCRDNPNLSFSGQGKMNNAIQGFFGELYTFGKEYFNLKHYAKDNKVKINFANIGSLKTTVKGRNAKATQSGIDNIITVNNKHYGIQVKNPFTTDLGFYKTYKANYTLNKSEYLYNEIFGFNEQQQEFFELLNLNLNNTTRPWVLRKNLKDFLYMYTGAFVRLETEQILDSEFQPYMKENLKHLKGQSINNVFFVLKGQLLPSSTILEGIIKQYNYFIESVEQAEKIVSSASNPLQIRYTNTIKKNIAPSVAASKYDPNYVHQGNAIEVDLKQIKINTALKLELPSIDSIRKDRLKR